MSSLLVIYGLPIIASGLFAACLAVVGAQIAARDRSMQTLCLSQGALLGVLLAIGLLTGVFHEHDPGLVWPFMGAFLGAASAFFLSERIVSSVESSRNSYFASLFSCLLATGYFVTAIFPGLEMHMSQKYFGDLAVITDEIAWVTIFMAVVSGAILVTTSRRLTRATFFETALGSPGSITGHQLPLLVFTLGLIAFSTQIMGLLFTVTALFVPTTVLAKVSGGYKVHLVACALIGFSASALGFVLSLAGAQLPTVPVVCFCMVGFAFAAAMLHRLRR
jgi:ABC-type Mn2+/Zn2+ transport system permease subunit